MIHLRNRFGNNFGQGDTSVSRELSLISRPYRIYVLDYKDHHQLFNLLSLLGELGLEERHFGLKMTSTTRRLHPRGRHVPGRTCPDINLIDK